MWTSASWAGMTVMELLCVTTHTVASLVIVYLGFAITEQAVMVRNDT